MCFCIGDAFSLEAQGLPTLTAWRNLDFYFPSGSGNGNGGSIGGFSNSDRDIKGEIESIATEDRMGMYTNHEIEVADRSTRRKRSPFTSESNSRAIIDPSRNFDRQSLRGRDPSAPATRGTVSCAESALPSTAGTGAHKSNCPGPYFHLSVPLTFRADRRTSSTTSSCPVTGRTPGRSLHRDGFF